MTRAGEPATKLLAGTFLVTTDPAPMTEFSPIVTPPMIVTPAAIHTFLSIAIGFASTYVLKARQSASTQLADLSAEGTA